MRYPFLSRKELEASYAYSAPFVFQDREAGIFYQTFEYDFNRTVATKFDVGISHMEADKGVQHTQGEAESVIGSSQSTSTDSQRSRALRVEVYGNSSKDVHSAIQYMTRWLNTTSLKGKPVTFLLLILECIGRFSH